jgi:3-methyladenine DNA glycosylase AlkD
MATWDDVRRIGMRFPGVQEAPSYHGMPALKAGGKPFCRLWSASEHDRDGVHGTEVAVVFCALEEKDALLTTSPDALFTTPHYDGHPALLVRLADVDEPLLAELVEDSYRLRAPKRLVRQLDLAGDGWDAVVDDLTRVLRAEATPERAEKEKAYLGSELDFLGASVPAVRRASKAVHLQHRDLPHDDLLRLVEALWARRIHELRMAAVVLLDHFADRLAPADLGWLQRLVRESATWALADGLAIWVVGSLLDRFPEDVAAELAAWAGHDDMWVRRASLLAHLPGLRRGEGDFDRFAALADPLLAEREAVIRKAIGWVLRDAGKHDPVRVVAWLEPRLDRASGLTVREALKHLPEQDRERLRRGLGR